MSNHSGKPSADSESQGPLEACRDFFTTLWREWKAEDGSVSRAYRVAVEGEREPVYPRGIAHSDLDEDCTALVPTRLSSPARTRGASAGAGSDAAYRTLGVRPTISDQELREYLRETVTGLEENRPEGWEERRRRLVQAYKTVMRERRTWREREHGLADSTQQYRRMSERDANFPVRGLWFVEWVQELNYAFTVEGKRAYPEPMVESGQRCPLCDGFGVYYSQLHIGFIKCSLCRGSGAPPEPPEDPSDPFCENCRGWGEVYNGFLGSWRECPECNG